MRDCTSIVEAYLRHENRGEDGRRQPQTMTEWNAKGVAAWERIAAATEGRLDVSRYNPGLGPIVTSDVGENRVSFLLVCCISVGCPYINRMFCSILRR